MSGAPLTDADKEAGSLKPRRRGPRPHHYAAAVMSVLAFIALGLMGVARFGVLTHRGRAFVVRQLDGLDLGAMGKLRISGLKGDLWTAFSLQSLSIIDKHGPWIAVRNLRIVWSPLELLDRRIHVQFLAADQVVLGHRPALGQGGAGGGRRLDVRIDRVQTRVETLPAFSVERGVFQVAGDFDLDPGGGVAGAIAAENLLHQGDGLDATFDLGVGRKMLLDARAHESRGGPIAGMLGLATGQPFDLEAKADGTVDSGQIRLQASNGGQIIAQADGDWVRKRGVARGWVSLAASRWTAGYRAALGPRLEFVLQQDQIRGSMKRVDARLFADNASLSASGPVDAARLSSDQGVALQVRVADLSKLIGQAGFGPARFSGRAKGASSDWDLQGQLELDRVSLQGYSLARAAGPIHLTSRKGELRLAGTADGVGGAGGGVWGALAGARPQVSLDASRLPDGRLLLRQIEAQGAGVILNASGGKGLLGDLNLKGKMQLANLGLARPGARGGVDVTWSAVQANARQPWRVALEGDARGFASGEPHLDHLLGERPHFSAEAAYGDGALALAKLDLAGAAARASGSGDLAKDGGLKVLLDWSASGPLALGPATFSGKARGSALIAGSLAEPRAALGADFDHIDLPQLSLSQARMSLNLVKGQNGFEGGFTLTATDPNGPAHAKAELKTSAAEIALQQIDADAGGASIQGALTLQGATLAGADLTLGVGRGAFLDRGRADARLKVSEPDGAPRADLSLSASDVVLKGQANVIRTLALKASGPLSQLPYTVAAEVEADEAPFKLEGGGVASRSGEGVALSFNGSGQFRRAGFKTLSPAQITLNGPDHRAQLDLALGGGRAEIQADQDGSELSAKAELTGVDLGALGEDLAGRFDANLSLSGEGGRLDGRLDAKLKGARSRDAPAKLAMNGAIAAVLSGPTLILDASIDGSGAGDHAQAHLVLPAEAAASPFRFTLDNAEPVTGQFVLNGELQPVWDLFFGDGRELGGQLAAKGSIGGSLKAPQITGHGALSHGRFEDAATGLKLRDISAEADLAGERLSVQRFAANDAHSGTLSGQGRLNFGPNGASTLTLTAHGFQLLDNETAKATASGAVTVVQDAKGHARLSGALTIDRADISAETSRAPAGVISLDVVEKNKPFSMNQGLQAQTLTGPSVDLDVSITAPRRIYVKGLGLDAELSLDAHVVGSTSDPQLQGSARIVRGDYDLAGNRFTIDDRGVIYLANSPDKIRLDLTATRDNPTLTAIIRIQGTAAKPQITLTSTPVLPDDEVLSQVLFGQSAAQLSPVQAAEVAAAVTTLATGGGFDVIGGLKNFAKLDRLALGGGDAATGFTVSGGKYIGSRVYLELTGGGRQGPSAQVEVKATKSLSVISQIGGEIGAKLQVRWRHDYGRPPKPK